MIMKYITMKFEKHDNELESKLKQSESYVEALEAFKSCIEELDRKMAIEINDKAGYLETVAKDIAFDEGFKEGVRFVMGCISKGEVFKYE